MKYLFLLAAMFFFLPVHAKAASNVCINYGHQSLTYNLKGQTTTDFNKLKEAGINCIRIVYMRYEATAPAGSNTQVENLAIFAKSKGFRVIIGGDWDTITPSDLPLYRTNVLKYAAFSQTNKIDQFSLGNEQEYRLDGISHEEWATFIGNLATEVKTIYAGKVSYETSGDFAPEWTGFSLGGLDLIGFNLYCGYGCNADYLQMSIDAHGKDHVYVSETNADMGDGGKYDRDRTHASELKSDFSKLLSFNVPLYYFTFGTCNNSHGVPTNWGIYQCNKLKQPLTAAILGIK